MEEKLKTFEWKVIATCGFQGSIDNSRGHMPTWESDLPGYFFRPVLVYEIKNKLANFLEGIFFAGFAPRHALFTLVSKQFLDFASLKDPRPFKRGISCRTFFAEKQKNTLNVGFRLDQQSLRYLLRK